MKQISDYLTFAVYFFASMVFVAMIFGLVGMPKEIAHPLVSASVIIALFLIIVSMIRKTVG